MDASVANWWNEEEYAVDINEEDYLISIESVDHSITTRAKYENRDASSDINNNNNNVGHLGWPQPKNPCNDQTGTLEIKFPRGG